MKNFLKNYLISILFLMLAFSIASPALKAQEVGSIVSGSYDSLLIGIDSKGVLTGYFMEGTGDDGQGNPRFSCTFFVFGEKRSDGNYDVTTWFPEYPEDVVKGILKYVGKADRKGVNLQLQGEHGGCWNVAPMIKEDGGVDFDLDSVGNWESIRMVAAERVYIFKSAEAKAPQKIYIVKNDVVRVLQKKGGMVEIKFVNNAGRATTGWMEPADFYPILPEE